MTVKDTLYKLGKSKFRSSFRLSKKDKEYIDNKGLDKIEVHARDLVIKKIGKYNTDSDGKQTPMHGHPVFKAMHACACCCRGCLYKWYRVNKDSDLSEEQINRIVNLLMSWIRKEYGDL